MSLSRSRNVESRLDTRVHCPSRLKQVQVMGPGGWGGVQVGEAGAPFAAPHLPCLPHSPTTLTAHIV